MGFTLVELLVAITVLASIATLGWRGLDTIFDARTRLSAEMERTRGIQLALAQMQADCEQVVAPSALRKRARIVITPSRLILVRNVHAEDQPSQLQVVAYMVKDGVLSRRASAGVRDTGALDMAWASASLEAPASEDVHLQSGVAGMAFRLWMNDGSGWRRPGIDVEAASTDTVPTGVEVIFEIAGLKSGIRKVFFLGAV